VSPIRPLWHASLDFLRVPDSAGRRCGPGSGPRRSLAIQFSRVPEPPRSTAYTGRTYAVEVTARLRPELAELPAYVEGKTVAGAIKLASNETVHGPLPSVRAAIDQAISAVNR
jgi:hypothetical protein